MHPSFHDWAGDKRLKGLVLLVLCLAAVSLVAYTYLSVKTGKYIYSGPTTISVRGVGEVTRIPDIATFSFGVRAQADEPAAAQKSAAEAGNVVIAYLKEQGIAEDDIKTLGYNLYPRYRDVVTPMSRTTSSQDFSENTSSMEIMPIGYDYASPEIIGYAVDQTVEVKVRDTSSAGALIAGVSERGATNVSGLVFTVDDDSAAKAEARAKAVADAQEKAKQLADTLGVRLVRLTYFGEEEESYYPMAYEKGYDGGVMPTGGPTLPPGENTVSSVVSLTYEIR